MEANLSRALVIQPTVVREAKLIALFDALFAIEIAVTISGMVMSGAVIAYRKRLNVHINLRYIVVNNAAQFILFAPSRFVIIGLIMDWESRGHSLTLALLLEA